MLAEVTLPDESVSAVREIVDALRKKQGVHVIDVVAGADGFSGYRLINGE